MNNNILELLMHVPALLAFSVDVVQPSNAGTTGHVAVATGADARVPGHPAPPAGQRLGQHHSTVPLHHPGGH